MGKYISGNKADLVLSGEDFFSRMLQLINGAQAFIHVHMYIWEADATGIEVAEALLQAAGRGVQVYVVVDGYGTRLPEYMATRFQQNGIRLRIFSPLRGLHPGRRLHHKIVVTDQMEALVGGINIADKYRGTALDRAWLDFAVWIKGPAAIQVVQICQRFWKEEKDVNEFVPPAGDMGVRVLQNNWYRGRRQISNSYRVQLGTARKEVLIVASYFLPGHRIRRAIARATKRGVRIRILLSGISDVPFVKAATQFLYDWLFRCDVEIYEWKPSVLHGKVMFVDGEWVTIGSYNINGLSDYGSIELNINISDIAFVSAAQQTVEELMLKGAEQVSRHRYRKKQNPLRQLGNWFSYYLLRLSLRLFLWLSEDAQTGKQ